jgi:glycerol-3-phosphate dehydrogenase (NAD(P)+)
MMQVAVVGGGAWGTACAIHLARKGIKALLWLYEPELCEIIRRTGENSFYLPGAPIPEAVECTSSLEQAVKAADDVILATPSFALRPTLQQAAPYLSDKKILLLSKGLETETFLRMSEVAFEIVGYNASVAVLSGPSFAREVAKGVFTAVVIASRNKQVSSHFQEMLHNERFRVYTSEDVTGVELGGALKNVMAIGAGMIEGLSLGSNTQAAYVTRALAEMRRLGKALGAKDATFMGLSGLGDLVLTCTGPLSRNRQFGVELARGKKAMEIVRDQRTVVEGYYTIDAAYRLSKTRSVEMPITEELYRIVYENKDIRTSLEDITARVYKEEEA